MLHDIKTYVDYDKFLQAVEAAKTAIPNKFCIVEHLVDVTEYDDSPDLTEIHPKDRDNVDFRICIFHPDKDNRIPRLKPVCDILESMQGVERAAIINIGPKSIMPKHIDDMERPLYEETPVYNVFTGFHIPQGELGVKVGEDIADVSKPIVFNAQIPHEAWNQTSQDWLSLLIYINKDTFKKE